MKLLILMVLPFVASVARAQTAATKTAIENKMQDQKTSTVFTYARFGEKLFCVPKESLKLDNLVGMREVAISNASTPGIKSSLICYQCCVGEEPHTKESCKKDNYDNFGQGKSCGCK